MANIKLFLLFSIAMLILIFPIPHTISIRYISALLILLPLLFMFKTLKLYKLNREIKYIFALIVILTLWIYFVAFFISDETSWSLSEIKSQWLTPMLYFFTFLMLGIYSTTVDKTFQKNVYAIIFLMFFVHIAYIDLYALKSYAINKVIISRFEGLTEGPDKSNYLTNILLSFIMTEIIYRLRIRKNFLNINNFTLAILFILTILSSVFEGMRNGVIAIIFLGITSTIFSLYNNKYFTKKFKMITTLFIVIIITIPAIYNFKNDKRWDTLMQTIPIALDTKNNRNWIDSKESLPKLNNGTTVSDSNYKRIAWFYEGLKLIIEHPLGMGFGRNAFGHGIKKKYHLQKQTGHSHSGLIDLGVGIGIVGVLLWSMFCLYIIYMSYKYIMLYNSYFAIIVFFNITGFYSRFLVDSNMRDHMFQTFLVILGISLIYMFKDKEDYEKNKLHTGK